MEHNLLNNVDIIRLENRNAGASGNTIKGDIVDMAGFEGALFIVAFQTVVNDAVVTFKIAHGDTNDTADMAATVATTGALTSDGTTIALSNKQLVLEIVNPVERYLEPQVVIATQNAPIDHITVIKFRKNLVPVQAQGSTVHASATHISPATA